MTTSNKPQTRRPEPCITIRRLGARTPVPSGHIARAVRYALGDHSVLSLNVAIVDDVHMAELHERYMGDPSPTDVLTFDLRDDRRSSEIEGEIVVSADTARREARRRKLDEADELLRYAIHGVLHLLGMDDRTAAGRRRMRREETRVLRELRTGAACLKPTAARKVSRSRR